MVAQRELFDAMVRHQLDLARYTRREAAVILRLLERHDAKVLAMLRQRLPHIRPGDISGARVRAILATAKEMRLDAWRDAHGRLRDDLVELGKVESAALARIVQASIPFPVTVNPIRAATLRDVVTGQPFAGGHNATSTLRQWFGRLAQADQQRLMGAIQLGVRGQETVDTMVRRIAGTRSRGFADGVLAISRRAAETAVRTAVNHVSNGAQLEFGRANADVVAGWQWVGMLDERLCPSCASRRGKFVPNGDRRPPSGMELLGDESPPAHPNDRCTLVPVLDLDGLARQIPDQLEEAA
jgi:hypothetical protein